MRSCFTPAHNSSLAANPSMYQYKLSTLCHSFLSDIALVYLSDLLCVYSQSRQLRSSSDSRTLRILHIKTKTFGYCSFFHAAPSVWNSLPHEIRHIQSATAFKTALKTHLFRFYLCYLNLYSLHLFLVIMSFDLLCGVCVCVCAVSYTHLTLPTRRTV